MDAQLATWVLRKLGNAALMVGFGILIGSGVSILIGPLGILMGTITGLFIAGVTLRDADARIEVQGPRES
jgi:hypothetical protein